MEYMIYPFSENTIPIVEYIEEYKKDINITKYVCPNAWLERVRPITDKDLETDFEATLGEVDGVVFCDVSEYSWLYRDSIKKIIKAVSMGKDVICSIRVVESDMKSIANTENYSEDRFHYLVKETDTSTLDADYIKRIDGIVVGVGRLMDGIDSSTSLYYLDSEFKKRGYTVVSVGCSSNCYLVDGYEFPKGIFEQAGKNKDKVLLINDFINQLQKKHSADIIMVQFPDSLMKYSDELTCDFGVDSFILSKALSVDYFVTNIPVENVDKTGLDGIFDTVNKQYSFEVDGLCVDSKMLDFANSVETGVMTYEFADKDSVDEYVKITEKSMENRIINSKNDICGYERIVDDCIERLS